MSATKAKTAKGKTAKAMAKGKAPGRKAAAGKTVKKVLSLKEQIAVNDKLLADTGCMFGLTELACKQADPGTYEAVWNILLNICNTGWVVGCKVSSSPVSAEGGDAVWVLHVPTGEAICTSKGI